MYLPEKYHFKILNVQSFLVLYIVDYNIPSHVLTPAYFLLIREDATAALVVFSYESSILIELDIFQEEKNRITGRKTLSSKLQTNKGTDSTHTTLGQN